MSSLLGCISPASCIRPPSVALVAEHALDDLAGFCGVDHFPFHFFIAHWEWGLHHLGSDGSGESSKKEVSAFVISRGVFGEVK